MKRGTLIVALVAVFVIALGSVAYASWADSTYTAWSEASGVSGGSPPSPHRDYASTSRDCGVCHAVHNAKSTGQILLADTKGNSCTYCHITTTVGVKTVYAQLEANLSNDMRGNHYYNVSSGGVTCSECHSVHSANTVGNGVYILRVQTDPSSGYWQQPTAGSGSVDDLNVTKWCSTCHPYYNTDYNGTSHVMTDTGTYTNPNRSASVPTTVAITSDNYCVDCHNAGNSTWKDVVDFPHYTPTNPRFLVDGITSTVNPGISVNNDAPCLRCHKWTGAGVSSSF